MKTSGFFRVFKYPELHNSSIVDGFSNTQNRGWFFDSDVFQIPMYSRFFDSDFWNTQNWLVLFLFFFKYPEVMVFFIKKTK